MSDCEQIKQIQASKRAWITEYKAAKGCAYCPENHPACLDFHHRDPFLKNPRLRGPSRGTFANLGWDELLFEVEKCEVVCANCHRKHHAEKTKPPIPMSMAPRRGANARNARLRAVIERI